MTAASGEMEAPLLEIISRDAAQAAGQRFFCTGESCKQGHLSPRVVRDGKCFECVRGSWERIRRRKGMQPFVACDARAAAKLSGDRIYSGNPCKYGHDGRRWTHNGGCVECNNLDSLRRAKASGYRAMKAWNRENRELANAARQRWRKTEEGRLSERAMWATRRARKRSAGGRFTRADVEVRLKAQRGRCAWCRVKLGSTYHVDHIEPLARGGSNEPRNLQILCQSCNCRKWSTDPIDFARREGRLL